MERRDPLGRPWPKNLEPIADRRRLLTEDEVDAIAHEVRTLPLSEVGRHVMPLVTHIAALGDQTCDQCRYWVRLDNAHASRGECTRVQVEPSPVRLSVAMQPDGVAEAHPALVTAFDWGCRSFEARAVESRDEAQCSAG